MLTSIQSAGVAQDVNLRNSWHAGDKARKWGIHPGFHIIDQLKIDTITCSNTTAIANEIGSYFANVCKIFTEQIPDSKKKIKYQVV